MTDALADTSVFIAREARRPLRVEGLPDRLAISVITIGELRAGVLAATDNTTRDRRLTTLTRVLTLEAFPIDQSVAEVWASLRILLRDHGMRLPVNDSWIAATAMAQGLPIVTQDDDYLELPGLRVIHV